MKVNYINGDIFSQIGYEICFALDSTFKFDVGLCKTLEEKYGLEEVFKNANADVWKGHGFAISVNAGGNKFNGLIVKALANQVPEYDNIEEAVKDLANSIKKENSIITRKLAFPHICCGSYDKRDWKVIEKLILDAFQDLDVEILFVEN